MQGSVAELRRLERRLARAARAERHASQEFNLEIRRTGRSPASERAHENALFRAERDVLRSVDELKRHLHWMGLGDCG
jgi:hypothetical protein